MKKMKKMKMKKMKNSLNLRRYKVCMRRMYREAPTFDILIYVYSLRGGEKY